MPLGRVEGEFGQDWGATKRLKFGGTHGKSFLQYYPKTTLNPWVENRAGESKVLLKVHLAVTAVGSADR